MTRVWPIPNNITNYSFDFCKKYKIILDTKYFSLERTFSDLIYIYEKCQNVPITLVELLFFRYWSIGS